MHDTNRKRLLVAAQQLSPLLNELVFVGGCVTGLYITNEAAASPRPTLDVDVIAAITSYGEYAVFGDRLRELGFTEDSREGAPICRWLHGDMVVDVMPLDEKVGFSNHWYRLAIETSQQRRLSAEIKIRVVTPPLFLATKLVAFNTRGKRDFFDSKDLEDIIALVDGRPEIVSEVSEAGREVRDFILKELATLFADTRFPDALSGYLLPDPASQARLAIVMQRFSEIFTPS